MLRKRKHLFKFQETKTKGMLPFATSRIVSICFKRTKGIKKKFSCNQQFEFISKRSVVVVVFRVQHSALKHCMFLKYLTTIKLPEGQYLKSCSGMFPHLQRTEGGIPGQSRLEEPIKMTVCAQEDPHLLPFPAIAAISRPQGSSISQLGPAEA